MNSSLLYYTLALSYLLRVRETTRACARFAYICIGEGVEQTAAAAAAEADGAWACGRADEKQA